MTENRDSENRENGKAEGARVTEEPGRPAGGGPEAGTSTPGSDAPGPGEPPRDPIGTVAEEALKLFEALQDRVMREIGKGVVKGGARAGMSGLGQAFGGRSEPRDVWREVIAETAHEDRGEEYICRACPICRMKAAARESRGDVTDHLLAAGGELIAAFRQALEALQRPPSGGRAGDRDREAPASRVERIDLD